MENVPEPKKPGEAVRGRSVLVGILIGGAVGTASIALTAAVAGAVAALSNGPGSPAILVGLAAGVAAYAAVLAWFVRTGEKAWAIGMGITAGVAALLSAACFAAVGAW